MSKALSVFGVFIYIILIFCIVLVLSCGMGDGLIIEKIKGDKGDTGDSGYNSLIETNRVESDFVLCPSKSGVLIVSGIDMNRDSVLNVSEITSSTFLCDGIDGENTSLTDYTFVEIIIPCDNIEPYSEILFRMANGQLVASFSDSLGGAFTRLSIIVPGTYQTSDKNNCVFQVSEDNEVTW